MNFSDEIRKIIIKNSKLAGVGHIGSSLSIADLVGVLYQDILQINNAQDHERDRFVLSKGHAVLALYAALFLKGFLSKEEIDSFSQNNSKIGVHPKHFLPGVEFTTGSLGQGITFAVGASLSAKIQKSNRKIYCLISDAELNEGSFWEAILFASHHKLKNLMILLDLNGQQALGRTEDVVNISDIAKKMSDFGFFVEEIDGHDQSVIRSTLQKFSEQKNDKPTFIVAKTISGKGVSFMEKSIPWHYKSMNDQEYKQACEELKI
jgi:transketolase